MALFFWIRKKKKKKALLGNVVAHCEQPSVILTAEEIVPLLPATYPFTN